MAGKFRTFVFGLVALVAVVVTAACVPANPPEIVGGSNNPVTFGPDPDVGSIATASEGAKRVVLWGDSDKDLRFDRFNGSTLPQDAQPTTIATVDNPSNQDSSWGPTAAALGGGTTLLAATQSSSGPFGFQDYIAVVDLRSPTNQRVNLSGDAPDLRFCEFTEPPDLDVAWNGTQFLLSKTCSDGAELFTITTAGVVTARATIAGASGVALSRNGNGFLASYVVSGNGFDVKAQRLNGSGGKVGGVLAIAGGAGNQHSPDAAPSGTTNLVVWATSDGLGDTDLAARTVSSTGVLGAVHSLADNGLDQTQPTVASGASGTWFTAWTEDDDDVVGTKVLSNGAPDVEDGFELAGGAGPQSQPILTPGANGTAFLTWIDSRTGDRLDFVRKLAADGFPFGPTTRSTRSPFPQACADVAAGNGQFLVVWQESRVQGNTNLFARRYGPGGQPQGGLIALSSAAGDQFCPRAAWNGSNWLVVWTDRRNGTADVFGALVSGTGAVTPSGGFAISARSSEQQSPEVAWNGTDFVVAWNDLRNGSQDVFAARVRPNRTVLDPNGLAVIIAAGPQRMPTVASTGGPTLIAWVSDAGVQRRILRTNGTFLGGVVTEGQTPGGSFGDAVAAASPSRLGVVYELTGSGGNVVFGAIDPSDGSKDGNITVLDPDEGVSWGGSDIAWDGARFVLRTTTFFSEAASSSVLLQSLTGSTTVSGDVSFQYSGAIASLPNGRSLVLGTRQQTLLIAAVNDAP